MNALDNIEKLLIVSPATSIKEFDKEFFDRKRADGYYILSFSCSILHMYDINFVPDGWSFIDPSTWFNCINEDKLLFMENKSDLIILDLYNEDGKYFRKNNMSSANFDRIHEMSVDFTKFKNVYSKMNSLYLEIGINQNCHVNWRENLVLYTGAKLNRLQKQQGFKNRGRLNVDKLACFLLPMVTHYMRNLKEIAAMCFWDFNSDRLHGFGIKSKDNGYNHYLRSIEIMGPEIKENLLESKINFIHIKGWQSI